LIVGIIGEVIEKMNSNQRRWLEILLKKHGIEPDKVDLQALYDTSISYQENKEEIMKKLNIGVELKPTQLKEKAKEEFTDYYQKQIDTLFTNSKERSGEGEELYKEISLYSPHSETLTISTLIAINQKVNVINLSRAGLGKTRSTCDLMKMLEIPFVLVSGRITPKVFFSKLEQVSNGGYMVIDESATLLREPIVKELLLSALWQGCVTWETEKETKEISKFKGTIIFNTNSIGNDAFTTALKDRVIFNHLILDNNQVKDKIKSSRTYTPDTKVWGKIKNNIFTNVPLPQEDYKMVESVIDTMECKSVRDEWRINTIAKGLNNIFGRVDYLKQMLRLDKLFIILSNPALRRADKVSEISSYKKVSERQARNIVTRFEENGEW
jgi:uncharacterized protein YfkK (UPF0435 family)